MNGQRKKNRLPVALTAVVLTLAPAAGAGITDGRSPDTIDAVLATTTIADGGPPDTRHAALAARSAASTPGDLRSPDTKEAAQLAHPTGSITVLRTGSESFDWTDAGIGAAGGFAIALIVGGVVLLARVGSKRKLAL